MKMRGEKKQQINKHENDFSILTVYVSTVSDPVILTVADALKLTRS